MLYARVLQTPMDTMYTRYSVISYELSYIWENQTFHGINWLKSPVKEVLQYQLLQEWNCIIKGHRKVIENNIHEKFAL
jgi:hypothetical protein